MLLRVSAVTIAVPDAACARIASSLKAASLCAEAHAEADAATAFVVRDKPGAKKVTVTAADGTVKAGQLLQVVAAIVQHVLSASSVEARKSCEALQQDDDCSQHAALQNAGQQRSQDQQSEQVIVLDGLRRASAAGKLPVVYEACFVP